MMEELGDGSTQLAYERGSCMVDPRTFTERLQAFYSHWQEHKDDLWGSADFFTLATPPPMSGDTRSVKSSAFSMWLLGYEFPDSVMVFGSKHIHFLFSEKNDDLLERVKVSAKDAVDVEVVIHEKLNGKDGTSKIDHVLQIMRTSKPVDHDAPIVGYLFEESHKGSLMEKWADKLRNSGLQLSDVTDGLLDILAIEVSDGGPDVITKLNSQEVDVNNASPYPFNEAEEEVQLMLNAFKPIRLSDIWIDPPFDSPEEETGVLEAHVDSFRYSTSSQDECVILHTNIKHVFFQPAEKEMSKTPLLHFHLHNHIMVGDTETKDLQFYAELMGRCLYLDESDETNEVQREEHISKIDIDFHNFVNKVHDNDQFKGLGFEFEQPLTKHGFYGVPSDRCSAGFIVPTSSCLVELTETPFLVITLAEIAIVSLEGNRRLLSKGQEKEFEFELTIVFKDLTRDVMTIYGISSTSLDGIKEWLDTERIEYHMSRTNLKWRGILDAFNAEPQVFTDVGGWEFLSLNDVDYEDEVHFETSSSSSSGDISDPDFVEVLTGMSDYEMFARVCTAICKEDVGE